MLIYKIYCLHTVDTIIVIQSKAHEERIKSFDFHRLYQILKDNENDLVNINVVGWINIPNAYIDEYIYVKTVCPNLDINDNFDAYITIEDPVTREAMAQLWGDKVGLTTKRAEMYQGGEINKSAFDPYRENIVDLSVFSYFKNYTTVPYQMFMNCKNLETI